MGEKTFVLLRTLKYGEYFVLEKGRWMEFQKKEFYRGAYEADVIAEGTQKQMFEFKRLTEEGV